MEIDSASEASGVPNHQQPTPDSYVSTSEPGEPTSRAQVLEELRARIRELEGSPFKGRHGGGGGGGAQGGGQTGGGGQEEDHYKCYICKVSFMLIFVESMLCVVVM